MFASIRGVRATFMAIALAFCAVPTLAAAEEAPSTVVSNLNAAALPLVNAKNNDATELGHVIQTHADIDNVLKRALGRKWKSLDAEQMAELKAQTLTLVSKAYASAMEGVQAADITYKAKGKREKSARVATTVSKSTGSVQVDYRLRLRAEGWKVVDVIISGVSIVAVYSADFEAVLAHKGVDGLIAALRERNS